MSLASIPQISLGTAVLIIFFVCVGYVFVRGVARVFIGSLALGLSAWIGFQVWQMAPALSVEWTGKSVGWITNGLPIVVFLFAFLCIRMVANFFARPFRNSSGERMPRSVMSLGFRLVFAIIPASLICLIGGMLVYHSAAVADVREHNGISMEAGKNVEPSFSQRLKSSLEASLPEKWLKILDPLAEPSRMSLAKLITAQSATPLQPIINPRSGEPIPRAIIVDEPVLQKLAREGKFDTLLRHPLLTKALADPKIQKLLHDLNL